MMNRELHSILLFDGDCNLCNKSVRFVAARDRADRFRFAPLRSEVGERLLREHGLREADGESVVLLENGRAYLRSSAALRIARRMGRLWPLLYGLVIVPRPVRDAVYNFVARHRYRWFGRGQTCEIDGRKRADFKLTARL